MKIEFSSIGDGTNVQVLLIDRLDAGEPPAEAVIDRVYTADHQGGIHYGEERGVPISARQIFQWVEESWAKPVIGGRYGHIHPYWAEREAKREAKRAVGGAE